MMDSSLGSLPTLIVPDDPVNSAIEKPKTPPPVEIELSRMPPAVVNQKAAAVVAEPTASAIETSKEHGAAPSRHPGASLRDDASLTEGQERSAAETAAVESRATEIEPKAAADTPAAVSTAQASTLLSPRETPRVKSNGDAFEIAFGESEQDQNGVDMNNNNDANPHTQPASSPGTIESAIPKPDQVAADPASSSIIATTVVSVPVVSSLPPPTAPVLSSKDYAAMAKRAQALAKLDRLAAGSKSVFDADMQDIGALGIGMQLYFMLTKYLSVLVDPLQLAYASLGNQGVSEDIASDPRLCLPKGEIDCNWTTVSTPFTSDPSTVSWIITVGDCVYSVCFLIFYLVFRYKAKQAIELHMTENLTPGKYAVYVRGLPPDAQEQEILDHFDRLYDLTKGDEYFPLWLSCCWGRRRKINKTLAADKCMAKNVGVVKNLDHLAGTSSPNKQMYLGTWIAEVSIGHPTGGLLRTFLKMEVLTKGIAETQELISILELEKQNSKPSSKKTAFKPADEKLLLDAKKKLGLLSADLEKKTSKIKAFKQVGGGSSPKKATAGSSKVDPGHIPGDTTTTSDKSKGKTALKAARKAATNTEQAFNLEACQCAFVVFNNLESKRRCLRDYRKSTWFFPHRNQPKLLRFRDGKSPLIVLPAPEPSNILWENLETTDRGRFYRRSLTNFITFLLLLFSCAIISGAQSAQTTFKAKMPPAGLCEWSLPQVFYGNDSFDSNPRISWDLQWDQNKTCAPGSNNEAQYYIAYTNGIVHDFVFEHPAVVQTPTPKRCIDPCISETSSATCSTLPCFDQDMIDEGEICETYLESHMLYCLCPDALTASLDEFGFFDGPQKLWEAYVPCRSFIKDYLAKNLFIVLAAGVVVIVNLLLKAILRAFANFERHSSESAKASAIAVKMFSAQFLNTAIIVLIVNSAIGVSKVPLASDLFKGKYRDFEREWYPTVGMGITMTMLINAFVPQGILFAQMFVVAPLLRMLKRRKIRTQEQMNKLYAGPQFDISVRYPMILNSVFVTMMFCGGSPVLLFIGAVAAAGTFWFDKLSVIHLYSIKTAYDEELGEIALSILPWTLVLHLGFSTWMYGNTQLMKSAMLDLTAALEFLGYTAPANSSDPNAVYKEFLEKASKIDILGQNGFMVKIVHSNVMTMFVFFLIVLVGIFLSTLWLQVLLPILKRTLSIILRAIWKRLKPRLVKLVGRNKNKKSEQMKSAKVVVDNTVAAPSVAPEVVGPASVDPPATAPTVGAIPGGEANLISTDATAPDEAPIAHEPTEEIPAKTDVLAPADDDANSLSMTPTGLGTMQLLVPKSAPPIEPSAALNVQPSVPAPTDVAAVLSPRMQAQKPQVIPEFTDFFRKSVPKKYIPDTKLGFAKNDEGELIRRWREETVINGIRREPGEQMRTWEAMQAPVKIYAIEANAKYKLANAELFAAAKRMRTASAALSKIEIVNLVQGDDGDEGHVELENKKEAQEIQENLIATEPVSIATSPSMAESAVIPPVSARVQSARVDVSSTVQVQDPIEASVSTVDPSSAALPEPETISANA